MHFLSLLFKSCLSLQPKPPSWTLSLILEFSLLLLPHGLAPESLASCLVISVLIDTSFNLSSSTAVFTCLSFLSLPLPHGYELLEARVFLCILLSTRHRLQHKADMDLSNEWWMSILNLIWIYFWKFSKWIKALMLSRGNFQHFDR